MEWIDDARGLDDLASEWDRLVPPGEPPFFRQRWFAAWWRAFGDSGRLAVATAWDGDSLAGVLPLSRSGSRLHALANDHTPIFRPLGDERACALLLDAAVRGGTVLLAPAVTAGDPYSDLWRAKASAAGRLVLSQQYQRQQIVRTDLTWPDYRAGLDRKFRRDLDRRIRRLHDEVAVETIVLEPPVDAERQLTLGFETEASGWKGKRGSAIRSDVRAEAFYRELAVAFSEHAELRVSALEVEGRYVAFDLALLGGNRAWILKGGFDEQFGRFAPGLALTLLQVERAHELGLAAVELLGESVSWKRRFANDEREQVFLGAYARTPQAIGLYAARAMRPWARTAYRRLPGHAVR